MSSSALGVQLRQQAVRVASRWIFATEAITYYYVFVWPYLYKLSGRYYTVFTPNVYEKSRADGRITRNTDALAMIEVRTTHLKRPLLE